MPAQVLPTADRFEAFCRELVSLGFREIDSCGVQQLIRETTPARSRTGHEVGFIYQPTDQKNDLEVVVWTTWLPDPGAARGEDAGWVVIRKKGQRSREYTSRPIHRTRGFLDRLFGWATIARARVEHRPKCPYCHDRYTEIAKRHDADLSTGRYVGSRFWECSYQYKHPGRERVTLEWDFPLSQIERKLARRLRQPRERYEKKLRAAGKPRKQAMLARKVRQPVS